MQSIYSKSSMLAMKSSTESDDVLGVTTMDAAKVSRQLPMQSSPKKANYIEEDELSTTASSGNETYGTTTKKISSVTDGKMDKWMMAQIWGLAAGVFMAAGFALLACAAAAMAIVVCCTRKDVVAETDQKSAPWAAGPRSGAAPVKKNLRPPAPNSGSKPRNAAPAAPQKMVILSSKRAVESPTNLGARSSAAIPARFPASSVPPMPTSTGPKITSAPNPVSTAELQKLLATPSTSRPVLAAAMRERQPQKFATNLPVKVVAAPIAPKSPPVAYTPVTFRKELVSIMKELAQHRNAAVAVGQVRAQGVPKDRQSAEFADILTRAMEERNGPVRRTYVAFAAGLAAGGEGSAFIMDECVKGTAEFFAEVYEELCTEVPRLDKIVECELVPTLRAVLSPEVMKAVSPFGM